jgi:lysophospholipase L1-like esterase
VSGLYLLVVPVLLAQPPGDAKRFTRWEKEITAIEKRLKEHPPAKGGVAFIGSSSIRLWNLTKSFPEMNAVNLGFGGSEMRDSTHFAPRVLFPLEPRAVVVYAGDNDIANRRTPEQVHDDFRAFVRLVHEKLPKAKILYIAVKPSIKRRSQFDTQRQANALIKKDCAADDRLVFVDIVPAMLGADGTPKPELFAKDGLHMSPKGYEVWAAAVKKALGR